MGNWEVRRADSVIPGRKGWACVDRDGVAVEIFEEYKHAAERAKLENDTAAMRARRQRKPRVQSTVDNCESPDY